MDKGVDKRYLDQFQNPVQPRIYTLIGYYFKNIYHVLEVKKNKNKKAIII